MATFIDDPRTLELARALAPMTRGTILGPNADPTKTSAKGFVTVNADEKDYTLPTASGGPLVTHLRDGLHARGYGYDGTRHVLLDRLKLADLVTASDDNLRLAFATFDPASADDVNSDLSANGYNIAAMTWLECVTYIKEKGITVTLPDTHAHATAWLRLMRQAVLVDLLDTGVVGLNVGAPGEGSGMAPAPALAPAAAPAPAPAAPAPAAPAAPALGAAPTTSAASGAEHEEAVTKQRGLLLLGFLKFKHPELAPGLMDATGALVSDAEVLLLMYAKEKIGFGTTFDCADFVTFARENLSPARTDEIDPVEMGRMVSEQIGSMESKIQEHFDKELQAMRTHQMDLTGAVHSLGAGEGADELHKRMVENAKRVAELEKAVKDTKEPPQSLLDLLEQEKQKGQLYLMAKSKKDGMDIVKFAEENDHFDEQTSKRYGELRTRKAKEQKIQVQARQGWVNIGTNYMASPPMMTGGALGYSAPPAYSAPPPAYSAPAPQYRSPPPSWNGATGGQRNHPATGANASPMAAMGRPVGSDVTPTFTDGPFGLRLMSAVLPARPVHLTSDRNLDSAPISAAVGGSVPRDVKCFYCGHTGHAQFECTILRNWKAQGKIDALGHPQGRW